MDRLFGRMVVTLLAGIALVGAGLNASAQDTVWKVHASTPAKPPQDRALGYCSQTSGQIGDFYPAYGTNGGTPLRLAGERGFCVYTGSGDSQIFVLASTLYTEQPSLAALAYYSQLAPTGNCEGNPASCYCTQLGGSDQFGGTTGAGGGWIDPNQPTFVLEACIFPDMSSIDSWGLFYHSAGIIRGIDLSTVLRYQNPYSGKK